MDFFNWVKGSLTSNKVIPFPYEGIEFLNNSPPIDQNLSDFHSNLTDFIKSILPNQTDISVRQYIIELLQKKISNAFETTKDLIIVLPCGSCLSGTFLPNADIDIALFLSPLSENPKLIMDKLIDTLSDISLPDSFIPLPQAKVPVLKFAVYPGIQIDLSIDELHGPLSVPSIRLIFSDYPCLLSAQIFLKTVLNYESLDQPYIGGISSYTLQIMLVAFIQYYGIPKNITELILGFCYFYGKEFNYYLTGIDVKNNGTFFPRPKDNIQYFESLFTMHIQDPLNPNNILGHNSFKIPQIKDVFFDLYLSIKNGKGIDYLKKLENQKFIFIETQNLLLNFSKKNNIELLPEI